MTVSHGFSVRALGIPPDGGRDSANEMAQPDWWQLIFAPGVDGDRGVPARSPDWLDTSFFSLHVTGVQPAEAHPWCGYTKR
jgi:hypothetical protein